MKINKAVLVLIHVQIDKPFQLLAFAVIVPITEFQMQLKEHALLLHALQDKLLIQMELVKLVENIEPLILIDTIVLQELIVQLEFLLMLMDFVQLLETSVMTTKNFQMIREVVLTLHVMQIKFGLWMDNVLIVQLIRFQTYQIEQQNVLMLHVMQIRKSIQMELVLLQHIHQ